MMAKRLAEAGGAAGAVPPFMGMGGMGAGGAGAGGHGGPMGPGGRPGGFTAMGMMPPMAGNQQTRHARRLYIGGCGEVSEEQLMKFFTDVVTRTCKSKLPMQPVLSVYVNHQRRFAFVEFCTMELAAAALQFDGVLFNNQPLRVRRPNDFRPDRVPPLSAPVELDLTDLPRAAPMGGGGFGGGGRRGLAPDANIKERLFIGGIPYSMTEPQVRELMEAFGPLKDLQLISDNGMPKGYGFAEYQDPACTDKAIQSLNGIRIGERELTVRRANPPGTGRQTQAQAAGMMMGMRGGMGMGMGMGMRMGMGGGMGPGGMGGGMGPGGMGPGGMGGGMGPGGMGGGMGAGGMGPGGMGPGGMAGAAAAGPPSTRVVVLSNMVTPEELGNPQEYKEILEDVQDECSKFGEVASIDMPRPGEPGCGKVYVEFRALDGAQKASAALNGRQFGPHTVVTTFMAEHLYAAKQFA